MTPAFLAASPKTLYFPLEADMDFYYLQKSQPLYILGALDIGCLEYRLYSLRMAWFSGAFDIGKKWPNIITVRDDVPKNVNIVRNQLFKT